MAEKQTPEERVSAKKINDPELKSISVISRQLEDLDDDALIRVLFFIVSKFSPVGFGFRGATKENGQS